MVLFARGYGWKGVSTKGDFVLIIVCPMIQGGVNLVKINQTIN